MPLEVMLAVCHQYLLQASSLLAAHESGARKLVLHVKMMPW